MQGYGYFPYYSQYPNYFANALNQNYNNQFAAQQQQALQNPIKVILVSNEDEAKATPADSSGNPTFFYNKSMNKIYLKQINPQTGAAPLQIFNAEITEEPVKEVQANPYQKDFNTIIEGINGLYRILSPLCVPQQQQASQPPISLEEPEEAIKVKKGGK